MSNLKIYNTLYGKKDLFKPRAGKKVNIHAPEITEICIVFKGKNPNVLIYRIQPNEGIILKILAKTPGHTVKIHPEYMQFCYKISETEQRFDRKIYRFRRAVRQGWCLWNSGKGRSVDRIN